MSNRRDQGFDATQCRCGACYSSINGLYRYIYRNKGIKKHFAAYKENSTAYNKYVIIYCVPQGFSNPRESV